MEMILAIILIVAAALTYYVWIILEGIGRIK